MKKIVFSFCLVFIICTAVGQQAKQLQFREETFDFGAVAEDKGPVVHEFVFTNNSSRPVKILSVQASCGCTTPDWTKEPVGAGKTGFIQASFNPQGRPGFFTKSLTVTTDLDANPIILQIKGQVNSKGVVNESDFANINGSLKFKSSAFNLGKVFLKDEYVVRDFPVLNGGTKAVTFTGTFVSPKHIKVDVTPSVLEPGAQGVVKVSYNGKIKNQYGFQSDNVELHTDDETNSIKSFSVFATLEEYFPVMSEEEFAKAPQLRVNAYNLDFGRIQSSAASVREVTFTNIGKKELSLRSLQGNCTCIKASAGKNTLKPGESSIIKIEFDPDRGGSQTKAVTIYSNDPRNPVQRITVTAYAEN
ncbi:MAG: DUF1573 domain-containing protein [Bacteroidota bacterium]